MKKRIVIIGGGPGGYVAAIRAAQMGASVTLVEQRRTGGTCLNVGCMPTKVFLHAAELYRSMQEEASVNGIFAEDIRFDWSKVLARKTEVVNHLVEGVEGLLQANGVEQISGRARLTGPRAVDVEGRSLTADSVIVATGSAPAIPPVPGLDDEGIMTSDQALSLPQLPQSLLILGGGVIGVELASIFATFGVAVTVVEMLPEILPNVDAEIAGLLRSDLTERGVKFYTGAKVKSVARSSSGYEMEVDSLPERLFAEKILVAAGRRPCASGLGLEEVGAEVVRGRLVVNPLMETRVKGVYGIGDCTGGIMLAHVASREGEVAVENIMAPEGCKVRMDYKTVPSAIYTKPAVASVGLSEADALRQGHRVRVGRFPLAGNGKSVITGDASGMAKIVADERYGEILGVHLIGGPATDMIAEAGVALRLEATLDEVLTTIHAHPTVSEAVAEAAMAALGRAIHFPPSN